ncbi:DUF3575 domain-containing protein [uncultured Algibacter sp.]|uniref:DUF3575 domain-containing protein n=1 Tax=uncultured Algibacter sp. TaxID=298659 RepID=UPI0032166ED0
MEDLVCKYRYRVISLALFFVLNTTTFAQTSIKGNVATALIGIPNFGFETNLGRKTTFQLDVTASFWTIKGVPYKFALLFPEFRYYTRRSGNGFFVGAHVGGGRYKLQKWNHDVSGDYQDGYSVFYGISLGYQFEISNRINLELFIGGGNQQGYYKAYSLKTGERTDGATDFNKSGEFLPYRGGLMLVYKLGR